MLVALSRGQSQVTFVGSVAIVAATDGTGLRSRQSKLTDRIILVVVYSLETSGASDIMSGSGGEVVVLGFTPT